MLGGRYPRSSAPQRGAPTHTRLEPSTSQPHHTQVVTAHFRLQRGAVLQQCARWHADAARDMEPAHVRRLETALCELRGLLDAL